MRWNPLARSDPSEGGGDDDVESGAGNADLNRQPSYSRGGGEIHSHNLHDASAFSNQPARRNRKRCMIETGIVAACAIALVIGLSVHYGQQKAVSSNLWSDEPVETEPAQNVDPSGTPLNPPDSDHDIHGPKENGQENKEEGPNLRPGLGGDGNGNGNGNGNGTTAIVNMTADDLLRGEEIRTALNAYTPTHVLDDPATPQHMAYRWLSYEDPQRLTESNATFRQRYVLATLFYSTAGRPNGTGGDVLQGWLQGSSECTWSGITCGGEFVVNEDESFGLFLDDGTGTFTDATQGGSKGEGGHREAAPSAQEERGNNTNKNSNQKKKGGENNETAGMTDYASGEGRPVVSVDLGGLGLGGILPGEVGALLSLEYFDMSFNDLEGPMPFTFGLLENLVVLRLDNNRLEGPIPGTIGELKSLKELYLQNNHFSGPIPQALGSLTALEVVHLNNNSLHGNIPESIGGLVGLRELEFGYNNLTGAVPLPICDLAIADFGVDYQHSLPQVECSCCVGGEEEPPSSPAPPPPPSYDANGTDVAAEPGDETSNEGAGPPGAALTWSQIGSDVFGTSDGNLFGSQVSMSRDGMRFAVGSIEDETGGFRSSTEVGSRGVIHVYEYLVAAGSTASSGVWTQVGPAIEVDSVHFHMSLSGDGARVAVGWAPQDSFNGVVRVYGFREGGDEWTQLGGNITSDLAYSLVGPVSLSNDGNRVAVGSPLYEGDKGRVDVYNYDSGSWTIVSVGVEGGDAGANFGSSVTLSGNGNFVAVGGPKTPVNDATGGAVSIHRVDSDWAKQGSDIVSEDPNFGQSVSIAENGIMVAVGAPSVDESDLTGGKVRVYRYDGSAWVEYGGLIEGSEVGSRFGSSVSLSAGGEAVVVGSPGVASSDATGQTSVYDIQNGIWTLRSTLNGTEPGDNMGYSVSTSADGGLAVSGAPMVNSDGRGYVRVEGYIEALAGSTPLS